MRQLLPECRDDVDPAEAYAEDQRTPSPERPWLLVNMIASADGGTAVEGRSGGLGGPADKAVFGAIRGVADIILVAAGTARAEAYRSPTLRADIVERRRRRGQTELPALAVVSRRLDLDASLPFFDPTGPRPIVITCTDAPPDRRQALEAVAHVMVFGTGTVDLPAALCGLGAQRGAKVVLAEGGPTFNGALADTELIDELCLSLAPALVGGASHRIVHDAGPLLTRLSLSRVLEDNGYLFLRYARPPRA